MDNRQEKVCGGVKVIQGSNYKWSVTDLEGNIIVPQGKYDWIDGFDSGLARVKNGKVSNAIRNSNSKWGIIDVNGTEVLPVEYDNIWNFYGKNRSSTKIVKDDVESDVLLSTLNPTLLLHSSKPSNTHVYNRYDDDIHESEYAGSYAYDVMGYSDDDISAAFEGDPDNYWNID